MVACVAGVLAGCGMMPASGPYGVAVTSEVASSVPYALIKLTPAVVDALAEYEPAVLAGTFMDRRPPTAIKFGIGDTIAVTVFEAAAGGLFIPIEAGVRPGNFV